MSILDLAGRPWVEFNVKSRQHREWFAQYLKTSSWSKCPVRFAFADSRSNVYTIEREMVQFYINHEFHGADTLAIGDASHDKTVSQIRKKTVDSVAA